MKEELSRRMSFIVRSVKQSSEVMEVRKEVGGCSLSWEREAEEEEEVLLTRHLTCYLAERYPSDVQVACLLLVAGSASRARRDIG
uniref:Uncharacterized protein n=1 Tax=Cucumis melo TaxID=3656 RepID=A0A9I9EB76_CUCME